MKWTAISGSLEVTEKMRLDVMHSIERVLNKGNGVVVGAALGVDSIAIVEVLNSKDGAERIQAILPTSLEIFERHYFKRADEGVITVKQATDLINLLKTLMAMNSDSLIEMDHTVLNRKTYFDRNTEIVKRADDLIAFQLNDSPGTQDTIDKAMKLGLKTKVFRYSY